MLAGLENMFDDMEPMMKKLKKKNYEKNSIQFKENYGAYFQEMTGYVEKAEDKEDAVKEIGRLVTDKVKERFASKKGKISSGTQADLNLFMIFYVFPTLLKTGHQNARDIADGICSQWAAAFRGNNIKYTDYDSLYETFREKIFGIL